MCACCGNDCHDASNHRAGQNYKSLFLVDGNFCGNQCWDQLTTHPCTNRALTVRATPQKPTHAELLSRFMPADLGSKALGGEVEQITGLIWAHLGSSGLILAHLGASGLIWACLSSSEFIWAHLRSSGVVFIAIYLGFEGFPWNNYSCRYFKQIYKSTFGFPGFG